MKMTEKTEQVQKNVVETVVVAVVEKKKGKERDPTSKQSKARILFQEMVAKNAKRGDIIKAFESEIGLTHNGAATYLQNFKNEFGLTVHKKKD
jgi:hypothetical protein